MSDPYESAELERAVTEAKRQAQAEADAHYRPQLVRTAFAFVLHGRLDAAELTERLDDLNLSRFITADGEVDLDKVRSKAAEMAPPARSSRTRRQAIAGTQAAPASGRHRGIGRGRELYDRLHPKRDSESQ